MPYTKRQWKAILSLVFCGAFSLSGLILLCKPAREYSENENRFLQQRPDFSAEAVGDGSWQADVTDYMSDQMPLRDAFTALLAKTQILLGKQDISGVYLGAEHRYFEKITDDDLSRTRYLTNLNAVLAVAQSQPELPFTVLLVPSAGTVQPQYLPAHAELYNAEYLYALAQSVLGERCTLADCRTAMKAHREEYLYYRTDHHWTTYGAWFGYAALAESLGIAATPYEELDVQPVSDAFYGTLYSKVLDTAAIPDTVSLRYNPPACRVTCDGTSTDRIYDMEALERKDHYAVFFGGNYGEVRIETNSASGKSLLIFKDSYANCLVPYLLDDFSEITMIDLRYQDGSWVERLHAQPDAVVFLYELSNFAQDPNLSTMLTALPK